MNEQLLGTLVVRLVGESRQFQSVIANATRSVDAMAAGFVSAGAVMTGAIVAPLVGIGVASVKAFANLDSALTRSAASFGNVSSGMRDQMEDTARAISRNSTTPARELAAAYRDLHHAGLNVVESQKALATVEEFAVANGLKMGEATKVLATVSGELGISLTQASNGLTKYSQDTGLTVEEVEKLVLTSRQAREEFMETATSIQGVSKKTADVIRDSFGGRMEKVSNQFHDLAVTIGEVLVPYVEKLPQIFFRAFQLVELDLVGVKLAFGSIGTFAVQFWTTAAKHIAQAWLWAWDKITFGSLGLKKVSEDLGTYLDGVYKKAGDARAELMDETGKEIDAIKKQTLEGGRTAEATSDKVARKQKTENEHLKENIRLRDQQGQQFSRRRFSFAASPTVRGGASLAALAVAPVLNFGAQTKEEREKLEEQDRERRSKMNRVAEGSRGGKMAGEKSPEALLAAKLEQRRLSELAMRGGRPSAQDEAAGGLNKPQMSLGEARAHGEMLRSTADRADMLDDLKRNSVTRGMMGMGAMGVSGFEALGKKIEAQTQLLRERTVVARAK